MELAGNILITLFVIFQVAFASYLLVPPALLLIYGICNIFGIKRPSQRQKKLNQKDHSFYILITAHQETKFIFPLVDSILKQSYRNFRVYVIADDCEVDGLNAAFAHHDQIHIIKPVSALNSKIKSISYGISRFEEKPDAIIILDADNLIHPSFLSTINDYFQKGYKVVQSNFQPKNTDTHFARMDAIGDMFNFFVEREARMYVGVSSAIWGSGVAIDFELYNEVSYTHMLGGFDKKLQSHLVQRVKMIAFAPEAVLYDEKITTGKSLETQRTRWISSYFKYFRESFFLLVKGIRKASFNLAYFGYITLRPPLFMTIGISILFAASSYFWNQQLFYGWLIVISLFFLSFLLIIAVKANDRRYLGTLARLPLFFFRQLMALFKIGRAKKSFLKTEHTNLVYIEDLLK